jgi:predicted helicase
MRHHLLTTFSRLSLLDLHGNTKKKERTPSGAPDENVFDIQQGVAIVLARRDDAKRRVDFQDLVGSREEKYSWLLGNVAQCSRAKTGSPTPEAYLFRSHDDTLSDEYSGFLPFERCMSENGDPAPGIVTTHDEFAISWTRDEAIEKVERFLATETETEARQQFTLCSQNQWNYKRAKNELVSGDWRKRLIRVLYRPFDWRWTVFDSHVAVHRRERVMRHMLDGKNIGLICTRQTKDEWGAVVTRDVCAHKTCGAYDINFLFPLYLRGNGDQLNLDSKRSRANISAYAASAFRRQTQEASAQDLTAEHLFDYFYSICYSPSYRGRYATFLKVNFPRMPLPGGRRLFHDLARLGSELVALHLMESPKLDHFITRYTGPKNPEVGRVGWSDDTIWLNAAATKRGQPAMPGSIGFHGVPEAVWNFHIGGY